MSIQFLTPEISSASLLQGAIPDAEAKCCRAASDLSGVDWPLCYLSACISSGTHTEV